jgi:undecaprenyl-diphosphatase
MRKYIHDFDIAVTALVKRIGNVEPLMQFFSTIGHPVVTLGIGGVMLIFGFLKENTKVFYTGMAIFLTMGAGSLLKLFFRRERPFTEYVTNMLFSTFSFPSGHTLGTTIAYGSAAYILSKLLPFPWGVAVIVVAILIIVGVGLSRIYLGAHHPSDVIAGWLVGAVGLCIVIFIIKPVIS